MTEIKRQGILFVFSSPSGAGKTTLTRRLVAEDDRVDLSVSATTRPPRPGEEEGVHYFFKDRAGFNTLIDAGGMLEYADVFGNLYGTPKAPVLSALALGQDVLFDIDWQGARLIGRALPEETVKIFILPPSAAELKSRLQGRGQDSDAVITARMAKAGAEASHWDEYDYIIVNRDLETAYKEVLNIVAAERLRRSRLLGMSGFVADLEAIR